MSKQVIMYNEESGDVKFAQVSDDTFVLSRAADGSWKSMTYGEWEALRCEQAAEATKERAKAELSAETAEDVCVFLDQFTKSMKVKYLEGKRSWGEIYSEIYEDFKQLSEK